MPDLEQIKISALDRKSLSSDLDYDDYLPFNDNSAGTEATKAVTIFALNSYIKNGVNAIARSAVSGESYASMPRIDATTISGERTRSTRVDANVLSGYLINGQDVIVDSISGSSISGATVSADTISAISVYGTVKSPFNIAGTSTSYTDSLHVNGDLHVHGSTITTSAENLSVKDPIIELAKDSLW